MPVIARSQARLKPEPQPPSESPTGKPTWAMVCCLPEPVSSKLDGKSGLESRHCSTVYTPQAASWVSHCIRIYFFFWMGMSFHLSGNSTRSKAVYVSLVEWRPAEMTFTNGSRVSYFLSVSGARSGRRKMLPGWALWWRRLWYCSLEIRRVSSPGVRQQVAWLQRPMLYPASFTTGFSWPNYLLQASLINTYRLKKRTLK